jgi:phytoene desaturase
MSEIFAMSSSTNKAIIIGAGVGGLATAIHLAKLGLDVTIFEKNGQPGGRCGRICKDGHRFDLGATIYLMPSIYRDAFEKLGLSVDQNLETKPLTNIYRLFFDDGVTFDFTTDQAAFTDQVEKLEPGSTDRIKTYVTKGYTMFQVSMNRLLGRNFTHLFQFINFRNIGLLFTIKAHLRHMPYIKRWVKEPHLQKILTFQNIYVGQNPYTAPALFSMLPAAELTEGSLFPIGGMYQVVDVLLQEAIRLGVKVHCASPVKQILVGHHRVDGVVLEDGHEHRADLVVANADLPYVYEHLLGDKRKTARLNRRSYSCSALVFHWGLDKRFPQLYHHNVFLAEPYKEGFDKIFIDKTLSETPSFYVHAPVTSDPSAAPEGQDTLTILVPVGHMDSTKQQDWQALMDTTRRFVLKRLSQEGMEDLEAHIKFELTAHPGDWNTHFNVTKGAVFGSLSHSLLQMGYFRPHNRHNRYKNLYFAGGSTHPGNGVPLVLLSAQLTSERIAADVARSQTESSTM